jgi:micrococcal nuclease
MWSKILVAALFILGLACAYGAADAPLPVLTGKVINVVDADTIDVELTSGPIRVRLHGIDSPERGQPWEDESTTALKKRILNQEVDIEPFQQDRYERLIGIVFLNDTNINAELVREGHAWAYRQYMRKEDGTLCADEARARLSGKGLWSLSRKDRVAPWEWRKRKNLKTFTNYSNETTRMCVESIGGKN